MAIAKSPNTDAHSRLKDAMARRLKLQKAGNPKRPYPNMKGRPSQHGN